MIVKFCGRSESIPFCIFFYHMTSLLFSGQRHVIKTYDHTCNNTLARRRNVIDNVRVSYAFSC